MSKILLFGGKGELGENLIKLNPDIFSPTRKEFDILNAREKNNDYKKLIKWFSEYDIFINAAEDSSGEYYTMFKVNTVFPSYLAEMIAKRKNKIFIHISTDKVFSGFSGDKAHDPYPAGFVIKPEFYTEINYSFTRWLAENNILMLIPRHRFLIIRAPRASRSFSGGIPSTWITSADYTDNQAKKIMDIVNNIEKYKDKGFVNLGLPGRPYSALFPGNEVFETDLNLDFSLELGD